MHLIQILLPLYDNAGAQQPGEAFEKTREELINRCGGLTAYTRVPAKGLWKEDASTTTRDDIVIYEVMAETLDESWWRSYRRMLEQRFEQDSIVVRAHEITIL